MTQATAHQASIGAAFRASDAVQSSISRIVGELESQRSAITGVRGPTSPEARQSFEDFMKLAGEVRGRPMLYPYIGSGIGNGALVELMDGSVKYDMITGIGVHFFGHSDPELVGCALEAATNDVVMQGHLMMNEEAIRFTKSLLDYAGRNSNLRHAFLCNSGAMANENALKVCYQKHAPASRVIAFSHCFMGRSVTMAQIGDSAAGRVGIPLTTQVDYMPFYDHAAAKRMQAGDVSGQTRYIDMCCWHLEQYIERYPKQHACFIYELVQGEGGFNTAPPEFFRALMQICKDRGIAVWADEVQTFGRTEEMFCFDALGLGDLVDVSCVGKMSQVCATLYTEEYNPQAGLLSGTFLGNSGGLRVGRQIIERLGSGDYYGKDGRIHRHHEVFRAGVRGLAQKHPEWFPAHHEVTDIVGGFGGMMRFTPFGGAKEPVLALCKVLFDEGVVAFYCGHGPYHMRFLPPLGVMKEEQWASVFEIVEKAMAKIAPTVPNAPASKVRPMQASANNGRG
ncbi:MAG: aminotransferase class III-fold pyridoxal phosphate-dependent enzyme [Phycisphaeraceae bacterium]|nr:MAG: aminotransferase class III-fold pyridoxal phosphate-dependent enzyme [Phycisphaeraceae bacterium]